MSYVVTDQNIQEILNKHSLIVLDFWADWCGPCKVFAPIFERVAQKNSDLFFGKVNTETETLLCEDFNIRSIPTLVIMKEQTIIYSESGSIPEYALNNIVTKARSIDVNSLESEDF